MAETNQLYMKAFGCVLSSAVAAELAKGNNQKASCFKAKKYTGPLLSSSQNLLETHYAQ
jgi:hydroxymethylpyrimidine/phosphomethylpyrimidine kinase